MAELDAMSDDQITQAIREMEAQVRREKNDLTNYKK